MCVCEQKPSGKRAEIDYCMLAVGVSRVKYLRIIHGIFRIYGAGIRTKNHDNNVSAIIIIILRYYTVYGVSRRIIYYIVVIIITTTTIFSSTAACITTTTRVYYIHMR